MFRKVAGESDDFGIDFTRRMSGVTGAGFAWYVPAGISLIASGTASGGKIINGRFASGTPGKVYTVSGYIDTSDGRRLYDSIDIHVG